MTDNLHDKLDKIELKLNSVHVDLKHYSKRLESVEDEMGKVKHHVSYMKGMGKALLGGLTLIGLLFGIIWQASRLL